MCNRNDRGPLCHLRGRWTGLSLCALCLVVLMAPLRSANAQFADVTDEAVSAEQTDGDTGAVPLLSAEELNALVAPVALYPDELLAIVLPAATNPLQIVEAQRLLDQHASDPSLQPDADWDPAIIALCNYPEVVKQMNDDLEWTQQLGNAVMDQQKEVLGAIQAARASAAEAGYLQSNEQQTVVEDNDTIVIESAQPDTVYVPTYDPAPIVNNTYVNYPPPVYSEPYPPYYAPGATFVAGAIVGATFAYAFDWGDDDIDIDCCGNGDVDIDNDINVNRGDVNIGSGNVNVDQTSMKNRFNGDQKAGSGGMKWSPQKARQKSTAPRPTATTRPSSANIQKQLSSGNKPAAVNVKSNKAVQKQSQRGQASLADTKKPKQQLQKNAAQKQQLNRQQQKPQKQATPQQLKQKPGSGGAFSEMKPQRQVQAQSNRGNKSLNKSAQARPNRR